MSYTEKTVNMLKIVASVVSLALLLWSIGLPTFFHFVEAASITSASDTLSNSAPSVVSDHTIEFTTPNGILVNGTFTITLPAGFDFDSITLSDIDLASTSVDQTLAAANGNGIWGVGTTSQVMTFTAPDDLEVASSTVLEVKIGNHATGGSNQMINPTTGSYIITIGGSMQDSGTMRVAIVDEVVVSASVNASLQFTVTGMAGGSSLLQGSPTTTAAVTTATTLPFETLVSGTSKTLAQDLAVITNAANGFTVTVEQTGALQSTLGDDIDGFINGSDTETPTAWQGPSGLVADENTYGHWALTSNDATTTRASEFTDAGDLWVSGSTTPIVVMGHTGPSDGATEGEGLTRVGYQIEISALQEAGDDYTTSLRYIVTPTF